MTFKIYPSKDGFRWRLVAANGQIVADSGEAYTRDADAKRAIDNLVGELAVEYIVEIAEKKPKRPRSKK